MRPYKISGEIIPGYAFIANRYGISFYLYGAFVQQQFPGTVVIRIAIQYNVPAAVPCGGIICIINNINSAITAVIPAFCIIDCLVAVNLIFCRSAPVPTTNTI
ncbi:hypothetical protein KRR40_40640 [Niabella defluvii]|nr:hypothetical protein KRR40_40640 [Niabella sp. I65]